MNEYQLACLLGGFAISIVLVIGIGIAFGKWMARRFHAAWLAKQPEQYQADDEFYRGTRWTPEQIAKMNADMRNDPPFGFNRIDLSKGE